MFVRRLAFVLVLICMHSTWVAVSTANEMEMHRVPVAKGTASHPVNGGRCLISDGEYQYIAFYDGDHQMTVGKRKLSETEWDFVKLPERVGWDTHNRVVLFQDRRGHLHITGNTQCSALLLPCRGPFWAVSLFWFPSDSAEVFLRALRLQENDKILSIALPSVPVAAIASRLGHR